MNIYGEVLSELMEKENMNQTEMSKRAGELGGSVTISYISKLLSGKMPPPTFKMNLLLSKILNSDPRLLLIASKKQQIYLENDLLLKELKELYPNREKSFYNEILFDVHFEALIQAKRQRLFN